MTAGHRRSAARTAPARTAPADDWLITYADTITLLMCLFVVLFAVSVQRKGVIPAAPQVKPPAAVIEVPQEIAPFARDGSIVPSWTGNAAINPADDGEPPAPAPIEAKQAVGAAAAPISIASPGLAERLHSPDTPIIEQHGEHVHTLQVSSTAFFATGSATLSSLGRAILLDVAAHLRSPEFAGYGITVEGHTDDAPVSSASFPSNWELSTARAAAVVRFLIVQGLPPGHLRAAGYADTRPVAPDRDPQGRPLPENQARNRRVVIRLDQLAA